VWYQQKCECSCKTVFNAKDPLASIRRKLSEGIRGRTEVLDRLIQTFDNILVSNESSVKAYLNAFEAKRADIIVSENSRHWLLSHPIWPNTGSCEAP
jgi:hypothetical protein